MGEGSSGAGATWPAGVGDGEATQTAAGGEPVTRPWLTEPASPSLHPPTEAVRPHPPTGIGPAQQLTETVLPQVPAALAGLTAERIWRTGRPPEPPRRPARLRRWLGAALTIILLAASGVVLYLRFHHSPFHVTGVVISQRRERMRCQRHRADHHQRLVRDDLLPVAIPARPATAPAAQPVRAVAGQHAVFVTVAVEGQGHGSVSQTVTLQVLGPNKGAASTAVVVRC